MLFIYITVKGLKRYKYIGTLFLKVKRTKIDVEKFKSRLI